VAFLLAVSFLAVNLLGAIGFFVSAVACALFYAALLPAKLPEQLAVEDMQLVITRRFALSVSVFLLLVFVFFYFISSIIGLEEARLQPLPFLLDTLWLRLFWSTALAFLGAIVVFAAVLLPLAYLNSRAMYGDYEQYKGHKREALHSVISIALGINKCTWLVREGKAEVLYPPVGGLARLGGPGVLIVQEGHAVILEKSGRLSRVVGRDLTWLQPLERVGVVLDLTTKAQTLEVEDVVTKDGIIIEKFQAWVFYRVIPGDRNKPGYHENGRYPFNDDVVLRLWDTEGGRTWQDSVRAITKTALRDVVSKHTLDEIFADSQNFRTQVKGDKAQSLGTDQFKGELCTQINLITVLFLGVEAIAADIGYIYIPPEARQQLMEKWMADWATKVAVSEKQAIIARGEAEATALSAQEAARARAQMQMISTITQAIGEMQGARAPSDLQRVISLRFIEALEKMATEHVTGFFLPSEILKMLGIGQDITGGTASVTDRTPPSTGGPSSA
jgi:regulator of protease activity HflC (stomatin/prohibitin superfamily)